MLEQAPNKFQIKVDSVETKPDGSTYIEINLFNDNFADNSQDVFLPFRLPEKAKLTICGSLQNSIQHVLGEMKCYLEPGLHLVPLTSEKNCNVEILPKSIVHTKFEVGPLNSYEQKPFVHRAELLFEPAIKIDNLLLTLSGIHDVIRDQRLQPLKPLKTYLPDKIKILAELLQSSADAAATVLLEKATFFLHQIHNFDPVLRVSFTGQISILDRAYISFNDIVLPAPLLPVPYAALEKLISKQPFATGQIQTNNEDKKKWTTAFKNMLSVIEGNLKIDSRIPKVVVKRITEDKTSIKTTLEQISPINISSEFKATISTDDYVHFNTPKITITCKDGSILTATAKSVVGIDPPSGKIDISIDDKSSLWEMLLSLEKTNPLLVGKTQLFLKTTNTKIKGGLSLQWENKNMSFSFPTPISFTSQIETPQPFNIDRGDSSLGGNIKACIVGDIGDKPQGSFFAQMQLDGILKHFLSIHIPIIPEMGIHNGNLTEQGEIGFSLQLSSILSFYKGNVPILTLDGSGFSCELHNVEFDLDNRKIIFPTNAAFLGKLQKSLIGIRGLENASIDFQWDFHTKPCLLRYKEKEVSLLSEDLRKGELTLLLDKTGKLSFEGMREGLYGVRYFNALVNPTKDIKHIFEILNSDDALGHVIRALQVFSSDFAEKLTDVRDCIRSARSIMKREGIKNPGQFIPRSSIARFLSLFFIGDTSLYEEMIPIVKQITKGKGLPVARTKQLLLQHFGEFEIDYELSMLLNWLNLVFSPGDPISRGEPEELYALTDDSTYTEELKDLPSANQIYQTIENGHVTSSFLDQIADLAPLLTTAQLEYILRPSTTSRNFNCLRRIRYIHKLKEHISLFAENYGGIEYTPQATIIATFLGEAVGPLPDINCDSKTQIWPPASMLGPKETAILIQAGLAMGRQGRQTQLNNRLLIEMLRRKPKLFTRHVMVEIGQQNPRALANILYAFLEQDQDHMANPVDLVEFLSECLDLKIPRQNDYLAGGRRARHSYYEALSKVADELIASSNDYLTKKMHLQIVRHPCQGPIVLSQRATTLEQRAQDAIQKADELGSQCNFDKTRDELKQLTQKEYQKAFDACAHLLKIEPRAFQLPWFKSFWARNEEALRILSVVRAHQKNIDDVQNWITVQSMKQDFIGEQDLLETIVRSLYYRTEDQMLLLKDPLVRLLIDPPLQKYNFTIIGCMGVITEGKDGAELEDAFHRLETLHGIKIRRAHTGTGRSLEYNAVKIIEEIRETKTPWGIIGYSQGCANALMAESVLLGGTPDEQQLLKNLVCRNFLFPAANGSAHGSIGMIKYIRAMIQGERFLKHYQAIYSKQVIRLVLRTIGTILDSRVFVHSLSGTHSLGFERARILHRDGQILDHIPTSTSRSIVSKRSLPEALEYLYYVLRKQTGDAEQDTQVLITDAIGGSTLVDNDNTRAMERCAIPALPQSTHHWAPLTKEIKFVTTQRDKDLAIYQSPKDQLVWPWIEVNARFGRIKPI